MTDDTEKENLREMPNGQLAVRFTPEMNTDINKILMDLESRYHPVEVLSILAGSYAKIFVVHQKNLPPFPQYLEMIKENVIAAASSLTAKKPH